MYDNETQNFCDGNCKECFPCVLFLTQLFHSLVQLPNFLQTRYGFLTELTFSKTYEINCSTFPYSSWLCRSLSHPLISLFQIVIYLKVFCTGVFPYHHCLLPWAFPSCITSWKAWCHGMMQYFIFTVLCLLFSDVFFSFVLVIPNQIWLLSAAELWVNILTNIFKVTEIFEE